MRIGIELSRQTFTLLLFVLAGFVISALAVYIATGSVKNHRIGVMAACFAGVAALVLAQAWWMQRKKATQRQRYIKAAKTVGLVTAFFVALAVLAWVMRALQLFAA